MIGLQLGVSKNSVISRVHRQKLPGRPSPIQPPNLDKQPRRAGRVTLDVAPAAHARAVGVNVFRRAGWRAVGVADIRTLEPLYRADVPPASLPIVGQALPIPAGVYPPARTCQWIEGEDRPFTSDRMCGARSETGYSWCPAHKARVFWTAKSRDEPAQEPARSGRVAMNTRSWA
jgi:hypothetical protein